MCYMNVWCTLYYGLYMFGYSSALRHRNRERARTEARSLRCAGAGYEALAFCFAHPEAARQVLLYCICGAAGQARTGRRRP